MNLLRKVLLCMYGLAYGICLMPVMPFVCAWEAMTAEPPRKPLPPPRSRCDHLWSESIFPDQGDCCLICGQTRRGTSVVESKPSDETWRYCADCRSYHAQDLHADQEDHA